MEFHFRRLTTSFLIIVSILLKCDGFRIDVECMRNTSPYCCRVKCDWIGINPLTNGDFNEAQCIVSGEKMECKTDLGNKSLPTPSTSSGIIDDKATCKISKKQSTYEVSCFYYDDKPICCDAPCEWNLNFTNAICKMSDKKIQCGGGGNPKQLELCFENSLCPHKPNDTDCYFGEGDTCYIYTAGLSAEQVSSETKRQVDQKKKDKNGTTPPPESCHYAKEDAWCNNNAIALFICIGIIIGIVIGVGINCLYKKKCRCRKGKDAPVTDTSPGSTPEEVVELQVNSRKLRGEEGMKRGDEK